MGCWTEGLSLLPDTNQSPPPPWFLVTGISPRAAHNTAADLIRVSKWTSKKESARKMEVTVFYNLTSGVTFHHFGNTLYQIESPRPAHT